MIDLSRRGVMAALASVPLGSGPALAQRAQGQPLLGSLRDIGLIKAMYRSADAGGAVVPV